MIIVTGGAGFIGSCLLRKLNDNGRNDIIVVDNLGKSDKWKNLNGKVFQTYFYKDEIFDFLEDNNSNIEAIVHLGACSDTTETDANYLMRNNYQFSQQLALYAIENDIRFIYASSAATYGDGSHSYSDNEFYALKPLNCYGFSKHAFDLWVIENGFDANIVGLKFFNVFGPNEYHKASMVSMVYKAFRQIKDTGKVKLFKSHNSDFIDGEQKRDFVYVKDCAEIMIHLLADKSINGIFNVGTGKAHSWNQLMQATFAAMNKNMIIEYVDMPENLVNQYQYFTEADVKNLKAALPDFSFSTLEESVEDYIKNYLSKEDIYY